MFFHVPFVLAATHTGRGSVDGERNTYLSMYPVLRNTCIYNTPCLPLADSRSVRLALHLARRQGYTCVCRS